MVDSGANPRNGKSHLAAPDEDVKEAFEVLGASGGLGVKLDGEERLGAMRNALVCLVVLVDENRLPVFGERLVVDRKTCGWLSALSLRLPPGHETRL